jgi:hypothetical protein
MEDPLRITRGFHRLEELLHALDQRVDHAAIMAVLHPD